MASLLSVAQYIAWSVGMRMEYAIANLMHAHEPLVGGVDDRLWVRRPRDERTIETLTVVVPGSC